MMLCRRLAQEDDFPRRENSSSEFFQGASWLGPPDNVLSAGFFYIYDAGREEKYSQENKESIKHSGKLFDELLSANDLTLPRISRKVFVCQRNAEEG